MRHISKIERFSRAYIAIGRFDGIHRGHLALVEKLVAAAQEGEAVSVLVSLYDPKQEVLTTEEEKAYLLQDSGVDVLLSLEYTDELAGMNYTQLIQDILVPKLGAVAVVSGDGHIARLEGCGLPMVVCPVVCSQAGEPITTQLLREAFDQADMDRFSQLAGHAYVMIGVVVHGAEKGRQVGQPTANLGVAENKLRPPCGVYATMSKVDGGVYMGLTNIGRRPSVDNFTYVTIETFILDFDRDIYDKTEVLEVHFLVRGVMKFRNLQEVRNQVQKDLQKVRDQLNAIYANYQE